MQFKLKDIQMVYNEQLYKLIESAENDVSLANRHLKRMASVVHLITGNQIQNMIDNVSDSSLISDRISTVLTIRTKTNLTTEQHNNIVAHLKTAKDNKYYGCHDNRFISSVLQVQLIISED